MYLWRRLDYASPEILPGEFYTGKEQDAWAYGTVANVLLVGEYLFLGVADAQASRVERSSAWDALDARCARGCELEGDKEGDAVRSAMRLSLCCGVSRSRSLLGPPPRRSSARDS